MFFRDFNTSRKLRALLIGASGSAMILTAGILVLVAYRWHDARLRRDLTSLSASMEHWSTAALEFLDVDAGLNVLEATLSNRPEARSAVIFAASERQVIEEELEFFTEDLQTALRLRIQTSLEELRAHPPVEALSTSEAGETEYPRRVLYPLATYGPTYGALPWTQRGTLQQGFDRDSWSYFHWIPEAGSDGEVLGAVWVELDPEVRREFLALALGGAAGSVALSTIFAVGLSSRLHRFVSQPLERLSELTREVTRTKDYRVRGVPETRDEIGQLVEDFNAMLSAIEERDREVREHRGRLRAEVEAQTRELRDLNRDFRLAKERAEEASRAKTRFLSFMSHELRTPLTSILGFTEMLIDEGKESGADEAWIEDLQRIQRSGKQLLELINDVLDLSRVEAGRIELDVSRFDLGDLLQDIVESLRAVAAKRGNRLRLHMSDDLGCVVSDALRLRQCLLNLLQNANKFTSKGDITLTARVSGREGREWVTFEVTDTGIGMERDQLQKIFEAFTQATRDTHKRYGGSGLGLTITRRFLGLLGGEVRVSSEPGCGSTFTVDLPRELGGGDASPAELAAPKESKPE